MFNKNMYFTAGSLGNTFNDHLCLIFWIIDLDNAVKQWVSFDHLAVSMFTYLSNGTDIMLSYLIAVMG